MRSFQLFLAFLTSTSALVLPRDASPTDPGPWYINNYNPGCGNSPAGCFYTFDISYSPSSDSSEPAFDTSCNGTNIQGGFESCVDGSVSSNEVPGFQKDTLFLRHVYTVGDATYTVTGNVTVTDFEHEDQSFVVVPDVITAVL